MTDGKDYIQGSTHIRFWGAEGDRTVEVENTPLTKREYFAAMAMQGMQSENPTTGLEPTVLTFWAVKMADALIDALNCQPEPAKSETTTETPGSVREDRK